MNNQTDIESTDDNVVVIEERDKRTYLYIVVAGVLGLAIGGLIGSSFTAKQWQSTYLELQEQYKSLEQDRETLVVTVEKRVAKVDDEVEQKLKAAMVEQQAKFDQQLQAMNTQVAELEKANLSLEEQLDGQKKQLADANKANNKLNYQANMQVTLLERSRELFQRELQVKQELEALMQERQELEPKLEALKTECNTYLDGTSWDAKSDSCDKQDEASSRISQINQMIRVHQMDLEQIKTIAEQLGME
ncbi:chromosome partitioning protein ParA [Vibrio scophthalmi]|uniref:chromosome partitioning protein ParA n=1 Tax=Vibrio scophthalmi TaxID=45658 RepID=UPI002284F539|nr:chromosome partitioning protein ParA [Vibrio scophthalmi]